MAGGGARRGRRDNGLFAAVYAPVGDVDPRVGEHLLDVLAIQGIAAYLQPAADLHPVTRATILPARPTDRLFVDHRHLTTARDYLAELGATGPESDPDGLGQNRPEHTGSASAKSDSSRGSTETAGRSAPPKEPTDRQVDREFADIVARLARDAPVTRPAWPAAEEIDPPSGPARPVSSGAASSPPSAKLADPTTAEATSAGTADAASAGQPAPEASESTTLAANDHPAIDRATTQPPATELPATEPSATEPSATEATTTDAPRASNPEPAAVAPPEPAATGTGTPSLLDALDSFGTNLSDEDEPGYEPPVPPPLPRIPPIPLIAALAVLAGMVLFFHPDVLGGDPTMVKLIAAAGMVAGFVTLVARLRSDDDSDDDPGDGAVV